MTLARWECQTRRTTTTSQVVWSFNAILIYWARLVRGGAKALAERPQLMLKVQANNLEVNDCCPISGNVLTIELTLHQ